MTGVRMWTIAILIWAPCRLAAAEQTSLSPGATTVIPVAVDLQAEWSAQYGELVRQIELGERLFPSRVRETVFRQEALILSSDRDPADVVLRRTTSLLNDITGLPDVADLGDQGRRLESLGDRLQATPLADEPARRELYRSLCKLRREIGFANPLLDFSDVLFIKREVNGPSWTQGTHMCDQYFGFHATPGGGLFVLEGAFSDSPRLRDLTGSNTCVSGRLAGQVLLGGFLAPELSFQADEVLFCFTEAQRLYPNWPNQWEPHWSPESTYHVFKMNADGGNLVQLTDGPENDLHPCYLPNGRVAFISERRGGFGRCHGRPVPCFTLHSMRDDGSDITVLSPHETNEWNPSVDNDGMIVFTRWDYVDRGHSQAHHPWICYPDGRDPRAIHGNWSESISSRPYQEQHVRAIPGSRKLIATACGHHSQVYGSLVLIDPRNKDDGRMSMLRRVTPEQWFPESEYRVYQGEGKYSTAWPLSEDYYLCVYYGGANDGLRPTSHEHYNYGVYLIDSFGNRELLYRDADFSCHKPIPLRPRRRPPVIPHATLVGRPDHNGVQTPIQEDRLPATGTVVVLNVYDAARPFPQGTEIKRLRVIQLLPKTTPVANQPRIGYGDQKGARRILGSAPVEPDGSAYFELPAGVPVYFQAIDQHGTAVQSMRSATWVAPGERLVCKGCHEPRESTLGAARSYPAALSRAASSLKADVSGSNPLSFPILVQGVLEAKCVACHAEKRTEGVANCPDLSRWGGNENGSGWYTSYRALRPYAFFWEHVAFDPAPKTTPGRFGARESRLYSLLLDGHHDVELTGEELHRIALWLDSNSDFYGAYENLREQEQGEVVEYTLQ